VKILKIVKPEKGLIARIKGQTFQTGDYSNVLISIEFYQVPRG